MAGPQYVMSDEWTVTVGGVPMAVRKCTAKEEAKEISVTNSKSAGSYEARGGRAKWSGTMELILDAQVAERTGVPAIKARAILTVSIKRATNDLGLSFSLLVLTYEFTLDEDDAVAIPITWVSTGPVTDATSIFVYP